MYVSQSPRSNYRQNNEVRYVMEKEQRPNNQPVQSKNSGSYHPVSNLEEPASRELGMVEHQRLDLALEEFPEGPYGATTNEIKLGKVSEWKPGQAYSGRFRDSNPVSSDRTVAETEPPFDSSEGSIEGQN